MGRGFWRTVATAMAIGCSLGVAGTAEAGYLVKSGRKLGRGIANVTTAPLEVLRTISLVSQQHGNLAGLTVGVVQGVVAAVVREVAGVVEVATFCIPIPKDFGPLVRPEFVWAYGDWVP